MIVKKSDISGMPFAPPQEAKPQQPKAQSIPTTAPTSGYSGFGLPQPAPTSGYNGFGLPSSKNVQINHPTTQRRQQYTSTTGSLPAVKEMQYSLINIYDTFKYYPMFNKDPDYREKNTNEYDYEAGSDTFLTFLLNRYVKKSPIIGQESQTNYPNALHGAGKDAKSASPINIIRLIESLKVFTKYNDNSKEFKEPNGIWNEYINNALKNLYAIVSGIYSLMEKLKLETTSYTESDLEELRDNIPQDPRSIQNKSKSAKAITNNIQKVKKLIGEFMSGMNREQGAYSEYVRQQKPFDAKFTNKPNWDNKDQEVFKLNSSPYVPITLFNLPKDISSPQLGEVPVMLSNIISKKDFEDFISNNKITVDGKDPLKDNTARDKLLSYMENQTKTMQPKTQSQEKWI